MNPKSSPMTNPIIAALDVDTKERALELAHELEDVVGGFKLGPRLCLRYGADIIKEVAKCGPVFVDNKHFDIPSTMEAAVRASFDAGASLVTVHALSGIEALTKMAQLEKELSAARPFKILAVTILTSWDQKQIPSVFKEAPISYMVEKLVDLVIESGMSGVVCSPHELSYLNHKGLYLVTPGIRNKLDDKNDQKRTMTSSEAISMGANALVVGRPIIESDNPREAALDLVVSCV